jgi:hypothetical protein
MIDKAIKSVQYRLYELSYVFRWIVFRFVAFASLRSIVFQRFFRKLLGEKLHL